MTDEAIKEQVTTALALADLDTVQACYDVLAEVSKHDSSYSEELETVLGQLRRISILYTEATNTKILETARKAWDRLTS